MEQGWGRGIRNSCVWVPCMLGRQPHPARGVSAATYHCPPHPEPLSDPAASRRPLQHAGHGHSHGSTKEDPNSTSWAPRFPHGQRTLSYKLKLLLPAA